MATGKSYQNQYEEAQRRLAEIEAQLKINNDALTNAASALEEAKASVAQGDAHPNTVAAAMREVEAQRAQVNTVTAWKVAAQSDLATLKDAVAGGDSNLSAAEQNNLELVRQRQNNQKNGRGYLTDEELAAKGEKSAAVAESGRRFDEELADRKAARGEQRTYQDSLLDFRKQQFEWQKESAATLEALKRGELTLKEAELQLNKSFNDRKIAMENIQNEMSAASQINTMATQNRQMDVSLQSRGEETAMGAMGLIQNMIEYMEPGQEVSLEDMLEAAGKIDDFALAAGKKRRDAIPHAQPHQTTVDTAAGRNRVGGVDEPTYTQKPGSGSAAQQPGPDGVVGTEDDPETDADPNAPAVVTRTTPEERAAARGKVTDPKIAFDYALADAYNNYAQSAGTGKKTWRGFQQWVVETGQTSPIDRKQFKELRATAKAQGGKVTPEQTEAALTEDRSQLSGGAYGIAPGTTPADREKAQASGGAFGIAPGTTPEERAAAQAPAPSPVPTAAPGARVARAVAAPVSPQDARLAEDQRVREQQGQAAAGAAPIPPVTGNPDSSSPGGPMYGPATDPNPQPLPAEEAGGAPGQYGAPTGADPILGPPAEERMIDPYGRLQRQGPVRYVLPNQPSRAGGDQYGVPASLQAPQQTGQPVIIKNYVGGAPQAGPEAAPVAPPVGQDPMAQVMQTENQKIKSQMTDQAAVAQTIDAMRQAGTDEEVIQAFAQEKGYDPNQVNPFNDFLNSQLQQAAGVPPLM